MENGTMPLRPTFLPNIKKDKYKVNSFEFKKWQFISEGETLFIFEDEYEYVARYDCICSVDKLWGLYSQEAGEFIYGDPIAGLYVFSIQGEYEFKVFQAMVSKFESEFGYTLDDDLAFQRMLEQSKVIVKAFCLDFEESVEISLPYITPGCEEFNFQMQKADFLSLVKQNNREIVSV